MITIIQKPVQFTPSGNPQYFVWTSDRQSILNYKVEIYVSTTYVNQPTYLISTIQVETTPNGDFKTATLNINALLDSYVSSTFKYNSSLSTGNDGYQVHTENFLRYELRITEQYIQNGVKYSGATFNAIDYYVFNGKLDDISMVNYDSKYLLLSPLTITNPLNFPKVKPLNGFNNLEYKRTYDESVEYLYFLSSLRGSHIKLKINAYINGTLTEIWKYDTINDINTSVPNTIIRYDVSPTKLFTPVQLEGLKVYTISVYYKAAGPITQDSEISQEVRYSYNKSLNCNVEPLNVWYENKFGVFENQLLINPNHTIDYDRVEMTVNEWRNNRYGNITNWNDFSEPLNNKNILNVVKQVLKVNLENRVELKSLHLNDNETKFLGQLFRSKRIYIDITDKIIVPCRVVESSYDLKKTKYLGLDRNIKTITLVFDNDIDENYIDFNEVYNPIIPGPNFVVNFNYRIQNGIMIIYEIIFNTAIQIATPITMRYRHVGNPNFTFIAFNSLAYPNASNPLIGTLASPIQLNIPSQISTGQPYWFHTTMDNNILDQAQRLIQLPILIQPIPIEPSPMPNTPQAIGLNELTNVNSPYDIRQIFNIPEQGTYIPLGEELKEGRLSTNNTIINSITENLLEETFTISLWFYTTTNSPFTIFNNSNFNLQYSSDSLILNGTPIEGDLNDLINGWNHIVIKYNSNEPKEIQFIVNNQILTSLIEIPSGSIFSGIEIGSNMNEIYFSDFYYSDQIVDDPIFDYDSYLGLFFNEYNLTENIYIKDDILHYIVPNLDSGEYAVSNFDGIVLFNIEVSKLEKLEPITINFGDYESYKDIVYSISDNLILDGEAEIGIVYTGNLSDKGISPGGIITKDVLGYGDIQIEFDSPTTPNTIINFKLYFNLEILNISYNPNNNELYFNEELVDTIDLEGLIVIQYRKSDIRILDKDSNVLYTYNHSITTALFLMISSNNPDIIQDTFTLKQISYVKPYGDDTEIGIEENPINRYKI